MKKIYYYITILITMLILLCFFISYFFLYPDIIEENALKYNLLLDGVQLYPSMFSIEEVDRLKEICKEETKKKL